MVEVSPLLAQRSTATSSIRVGDPGRAILNLWLFFNIAPSHFFLPLLCTSLLLARARRNALLVNVAVTWIITGFASSVLLYAGRQTGPEPSTLLCIGQASILYAVPPLASSAVFALVLSVWINLCWKRGERTGAFTLAAMLIGPYVVFFTFAAIGATIGGRDPTKVTRARRFFYCSIENPAFSAALAIYAAIVLLITMVLNCSIGVTIWRNNRLLKEVTRGPSRVYTGNLNAMDKKKGIKPDDIQFAIRLSIFGVYIVMGVTLSLLSIVAPTSAVPDMVFSTMGLAVFLVFGTQPKLWLIWRDIIRSKVPEEESHIPTLTPFQLDPLPGQEVPPPVPDKPWITRPTPEMSPNLAPGPSQMQQPLMTQTRIMTARFQEPRPSSHISLPDHPYRAAGATAPGPLRPRPRIVALESSSAPPQRIVQARGNQRAQSPFGLSVYEDYSSYLGVASPDESPYTAIERQSHLLTVAAASYESAYLRPVAVLTTLQQIGTGDRGSVHSQELVSGYATYNSSSDDGTREDDISSQSAGEAALLQRMQERARRTDPVVPRY